MAALHNRIPRTPEGHLAAILRTDVISPLLESDMNPQLPEDAYVPLNYDEGFPALPDGRPIWFKLEYESPDAFLAFQAYVDAGDAGPRYLADLLENAELRNLLGDELNLPALRNMYYMYYWKDRSASHDLFQDAAYRHIRIRRSLSTEDKSHVLATKILNKLETIFDGKDFWSIIQNDPALALSYLEKLTKIQRITSGLPAMAPAGSGSEGGTTSTSFEMIMRKTLEESGESIGGEGAGGTGSVIDERGRVISTNQEFMRGALRDPKTSKMMQEVVIRMTESLGATKKPRWSGRVDREEEDGDGGDEAPVEQNILPTELQGLVP